MPSRKIPKNYRSSTGIFQSYRNQKSISYESLLERDFFLLLEFDDKVLKYEEQPFTVKYTRNKSTYRYTPDCLVYYHSHTNKVPCVYEVKYSDELKEKKAFFENKFKQIERYVFDNDMDFKMFTELDINPVYLENAKFIYSYAFLENTQMIKKTLEICKEYPNHRLSEILNQISDNKFIQSEYIPYIWHLVFIEKLNIDFNSPINNNTIIGLNNG